MKLLAEVASTTRPYIWVCLVVLFLLHANVAAGQPNTFNYSPTSLSFGIPTGTSPAVSAAQPVTIVVTSGTITITGISTSEGSPFSASGNQCLAGPLTAPASCQISVTFNSASTTLSTDTLTISGSFDSIQVPLSGAFGAFKLWDSNTVQLSATNANFVTMATLGTASPALSCPASPSVILSSTPGAPIEGVLGKLLVDNYIALSINGTPVKTYLGRTNETYPPNSSALYSPTEAGLASPLGNVCQGSDADPDVISSGDVTNYFPECFNNSYRSNVNSLLGTTVDSITNTDGIPALDISSFFASLPVQTPVQTTVTALDAGGFSANSSLFLVTNCSLTGSAGGTATGVPTDPNNPSTEIQTLSPIPNTTVTMNDAFATAPPTGVIPEVTAIAIPYSVFEGLVANTSSAPSVCLRIKGLQINGQDVCGGFQIVCLNPTDGTATGDNCGSSTVRTLLDSVQFGSPDIPGPPFTTENNFETSCAPYLSTLSIPEGECAPFTGPGFLMFGDGDSNAPTPSCPLGVSLAGDACPLNTLTVFRGAADGGPGGSSVPKRNTIYIPTVNNVTAFTLLAILNHLDFWVSSANPWTVTFGSFAGLYFPFLDNPPANGFIAASPYSLTAGMTSPGQPIPDPAFPVAGDITNYNKGVSPNYVPPICPAGTASAFFSTVTSAQLFPVKPQDGIYNLHYFTTNCSYAEELRFEPTKDQQGDPTANWASLKYVPIGIDSVNPTITPSFTNGSIFALNSKVKVTYSCTDDRSGLANCGGVQLLCPAAPHAGVLSYTTPPIQVTTSKKGTFYVKATDCAGNSSTTATYTVK
jgi:hypothetical protein